MKLGAGCFWRVRLGGRVLAESHDIFKNPQAAVGNLRTLSKYLGLTCIEHPHDYKIMAKH